MRSVPEIIAKIESHKNDFFGFIASDLIAYLSFSDAKPFLKDEAKEAEWKPESVERDDVLAKMLGYMPFAWGKANDCRGLSAGRSIEHMRAWLWMIGEDRMSDLIEDYSHYGKPQLRAICNRFGWDWRQWDDGSWVTSESSSSEKPDDVPELVLA